MFEYSSGYEIDGSDTSYTIITPAQQSCREILGYYLGLKVVNKDFPITVRVAGGPDRQKLQGQKYTRARIPELCDDLFRHDITYAELKYLLVSPNSWYPEVKRELLDELIRLSGEKPALIVPEFRSSYDVHESIIISLSPEEAEKAYRYTSCACGDDYVKAILQTPYITIEFIISLGTPHVQHLYTMKKLSEAFPELRIDCTEVLYQIIYDDSDVSGWLDRYVMERIEIPAADYRQMLQHVAALDGFHFYRRNEKAAGDLDLTNAYGLDTSTSKYDYEYIDPYDDSRSHKPEPAARMLAGIFGKSSGLSISEYIDGMLKLSRGEYFTDTDFMYYTTVYCRLELDGKPYYGYLKFERCKDGPVMILCVPWKIRGQVVRLLNNI